jgi:hypothetical protein
MAESRFRPGLDFSGIERGLARVEARDVRAEERAREDARIEQARLDRITAQGFQGVAAQQRQQGIDIQREQLAAGIVQAQKAQQFKEQQAAEEQEFRESQARVSNNLAVINALPKGIPANKKLGILSKVFEDLDMDNNPLSGVDLTQIDVEDATKDITEVWKSFEDGKITKPQLEIAMQTVFAKHSESAAAKSAATTASAIARGEEATLRTEMATGGDKALVSQYQARVNSLERRRDAVNEFDEFILTPADRAAIDKKIQAFDDLIDEQLIPGFTRKVAPAPAPAPTPAPAVAAPAETPSPPEIPPPVELPPYLKGPDTTFAERSFYAKFIEANKEQLQGAIPSEKEFRDALKEAQDALAAKQAAIKAEAEQQALTSGGRGTVKSSTEEEIKKAFKGRQRSLQ